MKMITLVLVAIALAMDALGVTLSIGVLPNIKRRVKFTYMISFGFFQFFFIFLGGFIGIGFRNFISIPQWFGGIVVGVIGIIMIVDALKKKEDSVLLKKGMSIFLGISVSIDALVIGFTLMNKISILTLFINAVLVGLITFIICYIGFVVSDYIKKLDFIEKYSSFLGGIILIIMGIKMIFF